MNDSYPEFENRMKGAVEFLEEEFASLRVGRANPSVISKVMVDYYGSATPISQLANVSVPEPHMLLIQPWDAGIIKEVERAILKSDIGITPNNDGKMIRLNFPEPTEERRRELVKGIHKNAEESKVAVRNVRRDAVDKFKKMKKDGDLTEDDLKDAEKDIQELTDKYIKKIGDILQVKEKEIMEI